MLVENAFHYLPEVLCGSNYAVQEYEAGIVNAVSLALLQELNARNVPNSLSALTVEKLYKTDGFDRPDTNNKRRYLRADLHIDTSRTFLGTEALSRFGWRHRNYVEAKFFRPGGPPSTTNAALLLGDVIRLCCLTPPKVTGWKRKHNPKASPCDGEPSPDGKYKSICVGRYLLHVYEGDPLVLMGKRNRAWLKTLRQPGQGAIELSVGDDKAATFRNEISKSLESLKIKVDFTNFVISQIPATNCTQYLCVLTRIESFKISLGNLTWLETNERRGEESKPGDWRKLQAEVGKHILFKAKGRAASEEQAENTPPSDNETAKESESDLTAEMDLIAETNLTADVTMTAEHDLTAQADLQPVVDLRPSNETTSDG